MTIVQGRRSLWGQDSLSPQTNETGSSDLVPPCASTLVAKNYLVYCFLSPSWWKFPTIHVYSFYFLKLEDQKEKVSALEGLSY